MSNIAEFSDDNFEAEVVQSDKPVLVDFWAPWCGPCRMLMPVIEELAGQYDGEIKIGKVNVDENPTWSGKFGVSALPTLLFFKDGTVVNTLMGMPAKERIVEAIEQMQA